jgi:hypothetical protein
MLHKSQSLLQTLLAAYRSRRCKALSSAVLASWAALMPAARTAKQLLL